LGGISRYISETNSLPELSEHFVLQNSKNYLLENAQPISFGLDRYSRCSILTGANSGGKTTLIEHIIQLISLFHLGLPINGYFKTPLFTEVYYFAKNKGAASKGALKPSNPNV
jgi:dsDNA-specific endonuclease/ATPase MutS2